MSDLTLIVGNRNYSSWSMRAWLVLAQTGAPYREETIWLDTDPDRRERLAHSPAGRVPILKHGAVTVWDSLAIAEYLAELFPQAGLWPADDPARSRARSLCAEMHAGFLEIRTRLPMNCRARAAPRDRGQKVETEIRRVVEMWTDTRREFGTGGPFLFGSRTIADAFYAPIASRFRTYGISLSGEAAGYAETVLATSEVRAWMKIAEGEGHPIPFFDAEL